MAPPPARAKSVKMVVEEEEGACPSPVVPGNRAASMSSRLRRRPESDDPPPFHESREWFKVYGGSNRGRAAGTAQGKRRSQAPSNKAETVPPPADGESMENETSLMCTSYTGRNFDLMKAGRRWRKHVAPRISDPPGSGASPPSWFPSGSHHPATDGDPRGRTRRKSGHEFRPVEWITTKIRSTPGAADVRAERYATAAAEMANEDGVFEGEINLNAAEERIDLGDILIPRHSLLESWSREAPNFDDQERGQNDGWNAAHHLTPPHATEKSTGGSESCSGMGSRAADSPCAEAPLKNQVPTLDSSDPGEAQRDEHCTTINVPAPDSSRDTDGACGSRHPSPQRGTRVAELDPGKEGDPFSSTHFSVNTTAPLSPVAKLPFVQQLKHVGSTVKKSTRGPHNPTAKLVSAWRQLGPSPMADPSAASSMYNSTDVFRSDVVNRNDFPPTPGDVVELDGLGPRDPSYVSGTSQALPPRNLAPPSRTSTLSIFELQSCCGSDDAVVTSSDHHPDPRYGSMSRRSRTPSVMTKAPLPIMSRIPSDPPMGPLPELPEGHEELDKRRARRTSRASSRRSTRSSGHLTIPGPTHSHSSSGARSMAAAVTTLQSRGSPTKSYSIYSQKQGCSPRKGSCTRTTPSRSRRRGLRKSLTNAEMSSWTTANTATTGNTSSPSVYSQDSLPLSSTSGGGSSRSEKVRALKMIATASVRAKNVQKMMAVGDAKEHVPRDDERVTGGTADLFLKELPPTPLETGMDARPPSWQGCIRHYLSDQSGKSATGSHRSLGQVLSHSDIMVWVDCDPQTERFKASCLSRPTSRHGPSRGPSPSISMVMFDETMLREQAATSGQKCPSVRSHSSQASSAARRSDTQTPPASSSASSARSSGADSSRWLVPGGTSMTVRRSGDKSDVGLVDRMKKMEMENKRLRAAFVAFLMPVEAKVLATTEASVRLSHGSIADSQSPLLTGTPPPAGQGDAILDECLEWLGERRASLAVNEKHSVNEIQEEDGTRVLQMEIPQLDPL